MSDSKTQQQEIDDHLGEQRSLAGLLSIFGGLTLALTTVGLYGTVSYTVERRTKELGIRMALGAEKRDVLQTVLVETAILIAIGVAVGISISTGTTRFIAGMLFGVTTMDPLTVSFAVLGMFAVALVAGYIPARRATKVDPTVALRYE